jgi:uncharacterized membrane protein
MMPLEAISDGSFVWRFEFRSRAAQALPQRQALARRVRRVLEFIWNLIFGAWNLLGNQASAYSRDSHFLTLFL